MLDGEDIDPPDGAFCIVSELLPPAPLLPKPDGVVCVPELLVPPAPAPPIPGEVIVLELFGSDGVVPPAPDPPMPVDVLEVLGTQGVVPPAPAPLMPVDVPPVERPVSLLELLLLPPAPVPVIELPAESAPYANPAPRSNAAIATPDKTFLNSRMSIIHLLSSRHVSHGRVTLSQV